MKLRFAAALAAAAVHPGSGRSRADRWRRPGGDRETARRRRRHPRGRPGDGVGRHPRLRPARGHRDPDARHGRPPAPHVSGARGSAHDMYAKVPERYDSQPPGLELKLAETITALISVDADIDPSDLRRHPAGTPRGPTPEAGKPVGQRIQGPQGPDRQPRQRALPERARTRVSTASRSPIWRGCSGRRLPSNRPDWRRAERRSGRPWPPGSELRITHPNGTDLRMRVEGRPVDRQRRRDLGRGGEARRSLGHRVCCRPAR